VRKLIALAGPNGSGKTEWSLRLAHHINGAVIAADSRTVYRGLDIGTGKVTTEYSAIWHKTRHGPMAMIDGIEHYGLNVVDPRSQFTVANFQQYVDNLLPDLWGRGLVPMLVGGTGLYIDAVIRSFDLPEGSEPLVEWQDRTTEYLANQLQQQDPATAAKTDLRNRRRVERALAYHLNTGQSFLDKQAVKTRTFDAALFVIDRPRTELYARIDRRVDRWLAAGLRQEVEQLLEEGVPRDRIDAFGQVYRWALSLIEKRCTESEFSQGLKGELHAYARRQLTWWRRHKDVRWVSEYTDFEESVMHFLH